MRDRLTYIFVHGLAGWGSYDAAYKRMPYWGMLGGDLTAYLQNEGYDAYAASVVPNGSAWDRACELYAQLAGTVTDYGKAHSERYGHARFGRDYSREPLIPAFGDRKLVLFGHSFGEATIRLFAEMMNRGDAVEREASEGEGISDLFTGGMGNRIHAVVTLAAPHNGTTAYDLHEDLAFDPEAVKVSLVGRIGGKLLSKGTKRPASLHPEDCAAYDMHIDNAFALNRRIALYPETYYFSVPYSCTQMNDEGYHVPVRKKMEPHMIKASCQIGCYQGISHGGVILDETWRENDGLVNTVSEKAPMTDPSRKFDPDNILPGIWNVLPVRHSSHMSPQGGLFRRTDIRSFYTDLITTIGKLEN